MNKIFECVVGSHAYGTNIETSDVDIKGVYIQPNEDILGTKYTEQICADKDTTYYEVRRFLELASSANPTILEMLFTQPFSNPHSLFNHPAFACVLDARERFLTKKCMNSFGGYAVQQIKKARGLNKKMNWERDKIERKSPLDFCYVAVENGSLPLIGWLKSGKFKQENCGLQAINHMPNCYLLYYDLTGNFGYRGIAFEDSNDIRLSSIPKGEISTGLIYYNKDAYSIHCKEYNEYQEWLNNRNTQRYVDTTKHGQQIDGKNMMHCMRLIDCGIEIAQTGTFSVMRPNKDELLAIRRGEVDLEELLLEAERKLRIMEDLFKQSNLPNDIDKQFIHKLILQTRHEYWG